MAVTANPSHLDGRLTPMEEGGEVFVLPLSYAQQRLWFLDQMEPGSGTYNIPVALRLSGVLEVAALERALGEIVARHETLRTTFGTEDGEPVQLIQEATPFAPTMIDLSALSKDETERAAHRLILEETFRPFDLRTGPLFRTTLVTLGVDVQLLLLTMHHIISDGWSLGVFFRELATLYEAARAGLPSPIPPLPLQYADYAQWQRAWLTGETLNRQVNYWREQLSGAPAVCSLPTDHPRPSVQRYRGACLPVRLSREITSALQNLSRREGCTIFMSLLAAWQTLLARYSGQDDIVVGAPVANRTRVEIENLIGFFVNTLVLRTDLSGDPNFTELLVRVRKTTLGAYAHQDLPFEKLVETLQPARSRSYSPLFQVMLTLQNTPSQAPALEGMRTEYIELESRTAKFDLSLFLEEREGALVGLLEYDTDLYEPSTLIRLLGHFEMLLAGVTADPHQPLSLVPLLTEAERRQVVEEWNDTGTPYPTDRCVHHLFEKQAARTPDAVAVVFEDAQLSYAQLNARANQVAHHLRRLGVGPERLVGLCVERSLEMLVGLLGILKAGGAYVPLDPHYPKERLAFMLADAQVTALVTQSGVRDTLPETRAPIVLLDDAAEHLARESAANPTGVGSAADLAYVIYTSGSTGKPKGVMISHRALVNFLHTMQVEPGLTARDTLLAVTSLSFDIAGLELYLPLLVGARIVIAGQAVVGNGVALAALLARHAVTVLQATPVTWRMLLAADWVGQPGLTMLCGGEAAPFDLVQALLPRGASLWNLYGPTETTIWSTAGRLQAGDDRVTIGRPIGNTQVYVLDQARQPVPIDVLGELYIGGAGLARGYFRRPELTAERFVAHPFSTDPEARLYRTGDLARFRPDGTIECLGRLDSQVKLRGFRIELEEIETVLRVQPGVRDAAVIIREDQPGDTRLVAYVAPTDAPASPDALRAALQVKLPTYMVPALFVTVAALPLTPNGKVDRKALPAPDLDAVRGHTFVAPSTVTEVKLAAIWAEVLGTRQIGVNDNFFELGGHSLSAVQVLTRMRNQFGSGISLSILFDQPTLGGLAQNVTLRSRLVSEVRSLGTGAEADFEEMIL